MDKDNATKREILQQGQQGDFWRIICEFINESIEHLRGEQEGSELRTLPPEQYKVESELLKAKIQYLKKLSDYPNTIIGWLQNPNGEEKNYDPYE